MFEIVNHIGLIAFAVSGVLVADEKNMDVLGGYVIGFVTAIGGGTIRDLLLNTEIAWMTSPMELITIFIASTLAIFFQNHLVGWKRTLSIFDTIGISVFTVIGVQKGIIFGHLSVVAITLGLITATFGGVLRDVLCNRIPLIFSKELYAIPCIVGGVLFATGNYFGFGLTLWLPWVAMTLIAVFRFLSITNQWCLPLIKEINK